jgi:cytochrome c heme-lyase
MPNLSNTPTSSDQTFHLPTERETSSIPRGDADSNWEYPSPQQMYNAMMRKGGVGADQVGAVESMVAVHNYLNEGAWQEIRAWEKRFAPGLMQGWKESLKGEQRWAEEQAAAEERMERVARMGGKVDVGLSTGEPKLLRFMGRPKDLTPKVRIMPAKFS